MYSSAFFVPSPSKESIAFLYEVIKHLDHPYGFFFFFQAEDGIRDLTVTGVQKCALPIYPGGVALRFAAGVVRAPLHAVEGDLDDQRRLDVNRPLLARALAAEQPLRLPGEHVVGEALEGLADHDEAAARRVARPEVQVAEPAAPAPVPPLRGQHDEVERDRWLPLEPLGAAAAGAVGRLGRLEEHPLVALLEGLPQEALEVARVGRAERGDAQIGRHDLAEDPPALALRPGGAGMPAGQQAVEEAGAERHLPARLVDAELAAEPPHGVLEGLRSAAGAERDRLAVEDDLVGGEAAYALDHLGHRVGERLLRAAVDLDALARLVHLDADTVELRFDGDLAEALESLRRRGGGARQHGKNRPEEPDGASAEPRLALAERLLAHDGQVALDHERIAHRRGLDSRGRGHGLAEHTLERALAQLADQPARQERALRRRGAGEQRAESARALGRRPVPGEVAERSEGFADVLEAERRLRGRCGRPPRLIDGRRADPQPRAPGTSGEDSQRRSDCAGRHAAEEIGELPHLFGA